MHPKNQTFLEVHLLYEGNKKHSTEFKIHAITDMREHHLGYNEAARKYWEIERGQEHNYHKQLRR